MDLPAALRSLPAELRLRACAARLEPEITWILASPRSGTTWLATMLASLTGATLVDEPLIGAHLAAPVASVITLRPDGDPLLLDMNRGRESYFFAEDAAPAWLPGLRTLLLRRLAAAALASDGARRPVVVKEPNGALAAPVLLRALPRSRMVLLARDGRDVVDSLADGATDGWITDTHGATLAAAERASFLDERARVWARSVTALLHAFDAHAPTRRLLLTYEELRRDTATQLERVVRFTGRAAPAAEIATTVERYRFENMPADQTGPGRFARSATPGLWRDRLSSEEQARLWQLMGPALTALGYDEA